MAFANNQWEHSDDSVARRLQSKRERATPLSKEGDGRGRNVDYSEVELLSLLYSPQRYRSMVKTRDVNERRYGDTVSRDSAIAIHILNLSYLTISNLRIGEICADRIFFHPSIHPRYF